MSRPIQLFALHSAYGLMTAVAAIDAGLLGGEDDDIERILVPMNTAAVPETAPDLGSVPRLASLRARFDRIEALNPLLDPLHPTAWRPDDHDLPILERLLRRAWGLGDARLELFVQSPQVAPARTLMTLFSQAQLNVIGDGLMTYSPIRSALPRQVTERVARVVHPDVVPGVAPLVFVETGAIRVPVSAADLGRVLREAGRAQPDAALDTLVTPGVRTALVLGQYLSALGLMSADDETALQMRMIDRAADGGAQRVVFKPHPSAPPALSDALAQRASARGLDLATYAGDQPGEYVAHHLGAAAVIAGFSTALPTVRAVFGIPVHAVGADTVLARLTPYENSNRVPAVIVDALERRVAADELQGVVNAVGYAMQPDIAAHLRPSAIAALAAMTAADRERYVPPHRLRALDLPGAPAPTRWQRTGDQAGGVGRWEELRLTMEGAKRRARRVWKAASGR
ncbi:polysialyltransferase family glycosyltransferase [Microbacterium sp. NPDC089987]|uniref:polysialyltransferase family glycosyltransferase n=1 Tax=Microbacterium sp. NPDC089987 TaxID=3364202 RepID=UPI003824379C